MKKYLFFGGFFLLLFFLPLILAVNLEVQKTSSDEVMIIDLNEPAVFELSIKNNGATDEFMIYTFFGSGSLPEEKSTISSGQTKTIKFIVSPPYDVTKTGPAVFDYFIRGSDNSEYKGTLNAKVINLNEAFEIGSADFDPESNSVEIYIKNKINFNFENLDAEFSSNFFTLDKSFSLASKETKNFEITLDKEKFKQLTAGFYTLTAEITAEDIIADIEGVMKFAEKKSIITETEKQGFFVSTTTITKSNNGNLPEIVQTTVQKNIISRLFTSVNPSPDNVERNNSKIFYSWNRELKPGESLAVKIKTNWFLPLIFIILIIAIVIFVKEYAKTDLKIKKRVTFVKSKGGEFALKVSLLIDTRKPIENLLIVERIPPVLNLYKKVFGREIPTKIDEKSKKIEWQFKRLEAGEKRMINYVIYSKLGILGKFALPRTAGFYEKDGKLHEASSNQAFFLTEQKGN
ncbi:MAG: hypothetical protein QT10_C0007G0082 [archaeon GW2011_AR19]|nr:MAG: hypothetical protein QT10_C0007G0082 [archaeon GW2011_AR19]